MGDLPQYCERLLGFSSEPINTITNLAFLIAAYGSYRLTSQSNSTSIFLQLLPFIIASIGISSAVWHFTGWPLVAPLDTGSTAIAIIFTAFVLIKFEKLLPLPWRYGVLLSACLITAVVMTQPFININGSVMYFIPLSILCYFLVRVSRQYNTNTIPALVVSVVFFISILFRIADLRLCDTLGFGTHFLWHISNAIAAYFIVVTLNAIEMSNKRTKR